MRLNLQNFHARQSLLPTFLMIAASRASTYAIFPSRGIFGVSRGKVRFRRRVKTEFLVQMDGVAVSADDRILLIGATNRCTHITDLSPRD